MKKCPRRKRKSPGRKASKWYDLEEDWDLIEASFVTQYGIRLIETEMDWKEFTVLLYGLMPETPLGQIIKIRTEEDPDILKHFSEEEHRIRNDWRNRHSVIKEMTEEEKAEAAKKVQEIFAKAFG